MKKGYKHTELSNVECANDKCAMVNGREGVARNLIKQRLVDKATTDRPLYCYTCSVWKKTGMTRSEQRRARGLRVKDKEELKRAEAQKALEEKAKAGYQKKQKTMTAGA